MEYRSEVDAIQALESRVCSGAPDLAVLGGISGPWHHGRHIRSRSWMDHRDWQLAVVLVLATVGAGTVLDDAVADWLAGAPNAMSRSPHVIRF